MDVSPFLPGCQYRVLKSFQLYRQSFEEGEVLTYRAMDTLIKDGLTEYDFTDQAGRTREFFVDFEWSDDVVATFVAERFVRVSRDDLRS